MAALRFIGLKPQTLRSYRSALAHFFQWLDDENRPLPSRSHQLDEDLSEYLEHLWLDDVNITYAGHTLSAFRRFYPRIRYKLPQAKQFFSNWKSVHVPRQAVPMPPEVALALGGLAISIKDYTLAFLILVGFAAFLRTGEIASLEAQQIQVDLSSGRIILALPSTKTSRHRIESLVVSDQRLAHLASFVLSRQHQSALGGMNASQFRERLKVLLNFLGLGRFGFTGYSLRRGGASYAFTAGQHFDTLLIRGRWQSVKTARQYLDSGRAALVLLQFSPQQHHRLESFTAAAASFCEQLRKRRTS